jgi:hypothetical protein
MFENKNHDNPTIKVVADQEIEIGGSKSFTSYIAVEYRKNRI